MNDEELEDLMYRAGLTAQGCWDSMDQYAREAVIDFAKRVAAAEREACAKVCKNEEATLLHKEGLALPQGNPMLLKMASVANFCAAAIRARGEQEQPR